MAEMLIKASDYIHPDPEKDRRGVHKRGDIINSKPDGWSDHPNWKYSSYPYFRHDQFFDAPLLLEGKFILIKVPGLTVEEARAWRDSWRDNFGYEIVQTQPAQGRYTVRVFEQNAGATGQNNLTATKVRSFLEGWGCIDLAFTTNSCQFTFSLWNAVRSASFWEYPLVGIHFTFTLVSYSASSGVGRILVDFSAAPEHIIPEDVIRRIGTRGGTFVNVSGRTVTFDIERSDILQRFRDEVKQKAEHVYTRHRYGISSADVDAVISAGGIVTMTRAEFLAKLKDKMV